MWRIILLGVVVGLISPFFRRSNRVRAITLAAGAGIAIAVSAFDLVHPNPRIGTASIAANRKFELMILGCEGLAVIFAVASTRLHRIFWAGWSANLVLAAWLATIYIWLTFFWHW